VKNSHAERREILKKGDGVGDDVPRYMRCGTNRRKVLTTSHPTYSLTHSFKQCHTSSHTTTIRPPCTYRYDLSIEPDLVNFTFTGIVEITFSLDKSKITDENAKTITLHTHELCYSQASLSSSSGATTTSIAVQEINQNLKSKTVQFVFEKALTEIASGDDESDSVVKLKIEYSGFLNNQMAGFYRSHYTDIDGNKKVMASTQFEALDARRALPCIDEPSAKAVFAVTMTIPSHLHCFSNMPVAAKVSIPDGDENKKMTRYSFLDTPKMSTYLLAFCVGEFDSVQAATKSGGTMVQVYTPPGKSHHGTFALDAAVRALDAFDLFFGTHYPLPKLDMVAISEFAMGTSCFTCCCCFFVCCCCLLLLAVFF
jgi:aminopeptidase N